jgi:hypothetical protein
LGGPAQGVVAVAAAVAGVGGGGGQLADAVRGAVVGPGGREVRLGALRQTMLRVEFALINPARVAPGSQCAMALKKYLYRISATLARSASQ